MGNPFFAAFFNQAFKEYRPLMVGVLTKYKMQDKKGPNINGMALTFC